MGTDHTGLGLWPQPRALERRPGALALHGPVDLVADPGARPWLDTLASRLAWLRACPAETPRAGVVSIRLRRDLALPFEAFELVVDPDAGVTITASSADGAGHASVALRQLLPADAWRACPIDRASWTLPAVRLADEPAHEWRGFMLDVARHFTPKDELLRVVDRMAMHRLNRLQLHLTDDQGWRVASRAYPRLADVAASRAETMIGMVPLDGSTPELDGTPHGGVYTLDDLREITAYARALGITVVPELDLPAHSCALMAGIPELVTPGCPVPTVPGTFLPSGRVVSPLPDARAVLAELLAEVADAVDSPYFHVGGDEASLADWEGSPEVRASMAERGIVSMAGLRRDFNAFLEGEVRGLGRTAVMWDEAFAAGGLDPATIVMAWRSEEVGIAAMDAGHDVVQSPMAATYLDYSEDGDDEPLAIGRGQTLERLAAFAPRRPSAGSGRLLGVQAALWTELLPDPRLRSYRTFPRLSVIAAGAWTGRPTSWPASRAALEHHLLRLDAAGVEYRPLDGPRPWQRGGTGRRKATSPLTVDMVASMLAGSLDQSEMPDFAQLTDDRRVL